MDDDRLREVLTVLVEEIGALKVAVEDTSALHAQHSADIRNLASGVAATRRALDPEQLGKHVAAHIDGFLGEQVGLLAKAVKINHDAARQSTDLAAKLRDATAEAETANRGLRDIANRIEAHAGRSKWDWATLAAGMVIAALLAAAGAVYFNANFADAVRLIHNDDDAYWCNSAKGQTVKANDGSWFCAVGMPKYQIVEEGGNDAGE